MPFTSGGNPGFSNPGFKGGKKGKLSPAMQGAIKRRMGGKAKEEEIDPNSKGSGKFGGPKDPRSPGNNMRVSPDNPASRFKGGGAFGGNMRTAPGAPRPKADFRKQ